MTAELRNAVKVSLPPKRGAVNPSQLLARAIIPGRLPVEHRHSCERAALVLDFPCRSFQMADSESLGFNHPWYTVVSEIAYGSLTHLFEAVHAQLPDRRVALKVLRRSEHLDWFSRVVRDTACLCHPHVVPLYDLAAFEGMTFFAMEFVAGTSLIEELKRGPRWPNTDAIRIVRHAFGTS